MQNSKKVFIYNKIISIIVGAFLLGSMWRIRGDEGFGGFWGMLALSVVFSLYIFSIYGDRKKINYELFSLTVFLTAVTAGGWGTLNSQITGKLLSSINFAGPQSNYIEIHPLSGVIIMLFLGFGWMPFFAFLMGRFFSDRKYSFKDFAMVVLCYYAVNYISRMTASHLILNLLNPQAVNLFNNGLVDKGFDSNTWLAYLNHFFDIEWAKTISGGRNYFTSINVISAVFGTLAIWIFLEFIKKDKRAGRIMLWISCVFAASITIADLWLYWYWGGYHHVSLKAPSWLLGWEMWEFTTGFLAGLGFMILFSIASSGKSASNDASDEFLSKKRYFVRLIYNIFLTSGLVLFLSVFKPFVSRFFDLKLSDYLYIILIINFFISMVLFTVKKFHNRKNINRKNNFISFHLFARIAFPLYYLVFITIYFSKGKLNNFYPNSLMTWLMVLSIWIVYIGYAVISVVGYRIQRDGRLCQKSDC